MWSLSKSTRISSHPFHPLSLSLSPLSPLTFSRQSLLRVHVSRQPAFRGHLHKLALLSFCYVPTSSLYKRMSGYRQQIGHLFNLCPTAPSQGGCHWPGGAAETVSSLGVRMALSPAPAGDSVLRLHLFPRQKQMFASALQRKSSCEVVASQAVCSLGSLTALQNQLSDCVTVPLSNSGLERELKRRFLRLVSTLRAN